MPDPIIKTISQKLRGGYYTPPEIVGFICKWAITDTKQRILEPSCGDGNFLVSAIHRMREVGATNKQVQSNLTGVELMETEAAKALTRISSKGIDSNIVVNSDFFQFVQEAKNDLEFDVVIGNPPFIRYQNFPEHHREKAMKLMREQGLNPNRLTNIWVPFLVIASSLLSKCGKLGMVIPAELFQVNYASETRLFLSNFFDRVSIVTFKKLVFEGIQQEVVLLLCEKNVSKGRGIRVLEIENRDDLASFEIDRFQELEVKEIHHAKEKWTKYFLDKAEIGLMRRMKHDSRFTRLGEYLDIDVGIVTGRNKFFMLSKDVAQVHDLIPYTQRVVSKSPHLKGLQFYKKDFEENLDSGYNSLLFLPENEELEKLPAPCQKYIKYGEENDYHTGYKCRIRKRWYITPSLWIPDGFALRQVNQYPKLIVNLTKASSTDTIHRVRVRNGEDMTIMSISFLNSLTFAFSEIMGRSYGGGVLTFEPTEVEELPLAILQEWKVDEKKIDQLLRKKDIIAVLDIVDQALLIEQCGLSQKEVNDLRAIWVKMRDRRLNRKKGKRKASKS